LALIGLTLLTLAAVGGGLGLRWDPFDFRQKRLEAALARATRAESEAGARRIEAAGQAEQVGRVEIHHRQTLAVERATVAAVTRARSADDANEPLGAVRADRLRAHDRELCRLAPDLDGCAAASGPG
jgi:hypothetical protein